MTIYLRRRSPAINLRLWFTTRKVSISFVERLFCKKNCSLIYVSTKQNVGQEKLQKFQTDDNSGFKLSFYLILNYDRFYFSQFEFKFS